MLYIYKFSICHRVILSTECAVPLQTFHWPGETICYSLKFWPLELSNSICENNIFHDMIQQIIMILKSLRSSRIRYIVLGVADCFSILYLFYSGTHLSFGPQVKFHICRLTYKEIPILYSGSLYALVMYMI